MADEREAYLRDLLAKVHERQAAGARTHAGLHLEAHDGQFLGRVVPNSNDEDSLLNMHGPFGSRYSATSIFNPYGEHGSQYGRNSILNPYASDPPALRYNETTLAYITTNPYKQPRIDPRVFEYVLREDFSRLDPGKLLQGGVAALERMSRGHIEGADGTFLGTLTSQFDADSVFNQFGPYGSRFSPTSVYNTYGKYGNRYSDLSAFNERAGRPPTLIVEGVLRGHLTTNPRFEDRVDPKNLQAWAERHVRRW